MARRATDWDGPNKDYECVVEPLPSGRTRWEAMHKGTRLDGGESRWRWRASKRAENACRAHAYELALRRLSESRDQPARWNPYL